MCRYVSLNLMPYVLQKTAKWRSYGHVNDLKSVLKKIAPNDGCVHWKCGVVHVLINSLTFLHNLNMSSLGGVKLEITIKSVKQILNLKICGVTSRERETGYFKRTLETWWTSNVDNAWMHCHWLTHHDSILLDHTTYVIWKWCFFFSTLISSHSNAHSVTILSFLVAYRVSN